MNEILKVVMYLVLTLIVISIIVYMVTGLSPLSFFKKLGQTFEPGKLDVAAEEKNLKIDCVGAIYVLTLDSPKFNYREKSGEKSVDFIIVLDYNRLLFVGKYADSSKDIIRCSPEPGSDEFQCPQNLKIEFELKGVEQPTGEQSFHFTTWHAKPAVVAAANSAEETGMTLSSMIDSYSDYYISSFDVTADTAKKCKETECSRIDNKGECTAKNDEGCYWGGLFVSCKFCPSSTRCSDYDGPQCNQCPIPKANCKPGALWECVVG